MRLNTQRAMHGRMRHAARSWAVDRHCVGKVVSKTVTTFKGRLEAHGYLLSTRTPLLRRKSPSAALSGSVHCRFAESSSRSRAQLKAPAHRGQCQKSALPSTERPDVGLGLGRALARELLHMAVRRHCSDTRACTESNSWGRQRRVRHGALKGSLDQHVVPMRKP